MTAIGVLGAGRMGRPIIEALVRAGHDVLVWDPREDQGATVEGAAELLAKEGGDARRVLVVDSLQSAAGWACDDPKDETRRKIDRRLATLLGLARRLRLCIIVTSELTRAGYANGSENIGGMSTFKESGGIEYLADQLFVLASSKDQVSVSIPKTRNGETNAQLTLVRGDWLEFSESETKVPRSKAEADDEKYDEALRRLVLALRESPLPISSVDAACVLAGVDKTYGRVALKIGLARGAIVDLSQGVGRVRQFRSAPGGIVVPIRPGIHPPTTERS
jgi:hypothetical protein